MNSAPPRPPKGGFHPAETVGEWGSRALLWLGKTLAPRHERGRLRDEWNAELQYMKGLGVGPSCLIRMALGAVADGWTRKKLQWTKPRGMGMDGWTRDLRHGVRSLAKARGFSLLAGAILSIGLAGVVVVSTLLHQVVLDPLDYPDADRLVALWNGVPGLSEGTEWGFSTAQYQYYSEHATQLEELAVYRRGSLNVETDGRPERAQVLYTTHELLPMLGAKIVAGRGFQPEDIRPGNNDPVLLSESFWETHYGRDLAIVGQVVRFQGTSQVVVGIVGDDFALPYEAGNGRPDAFAPLVIDAEGRFYNNHVFQALGRLSPTASAETAGAELKAFTGRLPERFPQAYSESFFERYGFSTEAGSLQARVTQDIAGNLWILMGSVGLLLVLACSNVANLLVVRFDARSQELAVRSAMGAGRRALARLLLTESLLLSLASGLAGLLFAAAAIPWIVRIAPEGTPRLGDVGLGWEAVGFTLLVSTLVGIVTAAYPLAQLRRWGTREVAKGRRTTDGMRHQSIQRSLVVAQVALAFALVAGAGLLAKSVHHLQTKSTGIAPEGVATARIALTPDSLTTAVSVWQTHRAILDRLEALPEVRVAGMSQSLPHQGGFGCTVQGIEDQATLARLAETGQTTCAGQVNATPGYFEAMGIPILAGRGFEDRDNDNPEVASVVVSRAFADRMWPGEDAIGKGIGPSGMTEDPFYRVVGLAGNIVGQGVDPEPALAVYYPLVNQPETRRWWSATEMAIVVATTMDDPTDVYPALRRIVAEEAPSAALLNLEPMSVVVAASRARVTFVAQLLYFAALLGLTLAGAGLYGIVAYVVSRRTREIGTRLAIGAQPMAMQSMLVRHSMTVVIAGLVVGLGITLAGGRALTTILHGVNPVDPWVFSATIFVLLAVALSASWVPARRAARIAPSQALRAE